MYAEELAKLTVASITPFWDLSMLSTLIAHEAQLKPVTGNVFFIVASILLFFSKVKAGRLCDCYDIIDLVYDIFVPKPRQVVYVCSLLFA
jgi:hypothetical protein